MHDRCKRARARARCAVVALLASWVILLLVYSSSVGARTYKQRQSDAVLKSDEAESERERERGDIKHILIRSRIRMGVYVGSNIAINLTPNSSCSATYFQYNPISSIYYTIVATYIYAGSLSIASCIRDRRGGNKANGRDTNCMRRTKNLLHAGHA